VACRNAVDREVAARISKRRLLRNIGTAGGDSEKPKKSGAKKRKKAVRAR
jgi:hypothetical protein